GGMMSNDPAVWGITEAFRTGIAQDLKDIIVISIGTGMYPGMAGIGIHNNTCWDCPTTANGNWGLYEWVLADDLKNLEGQEESSGVMIDIILDALQMATDAQLQALQKSGLTYFRLEPTLAMSQSDMDNITPANIQSLIDTTRSYLSSVDGQATLSQVVAALKGN
ncbi:MAG: hypothetical protein JNK77_03655, partial [Saprospiraceae bacterium]|nr:hypothetical protein [Saprospiraceae bacterium]